MRGDEAQLEGESHRRATTGPRHAAPRKSMLTRLHMPAGKAVALAAMPTAVLMGMGLTPQLAQADPKNPGPFKPGKCVSQPDEADEKEAEKAEDEAAKAEKEAEEAKEEAAKDKAGDTPEPSGSASPEPEPSGSAGSGEEEAGEAEPAPSESGTKNPLDPLGVGDALGNLFGGGEDEQPADEPSGTGEPEASAEAGAEESPDAPAPEDGAGKAVEDTVGGLTDGAKSALEKAEEKAEKAREEAEKAAEGAGAAVPGADGLQPFPCPEYDPQALADAELEKTPLLPDDPWTLESSKLSLHGLDYQGIVKVKTWSGEVKEVLKFTAKGVDIKDLHQLVVGPNGTTSHVKAAEGSNSTIRNGEVTMYTEELKGNLLGIIPITFSPKSPPPLNIPEVFFTQVTVKQAGQFGGELTVPGMHLYNEA
ncbi:hydrogenase expression protein HypF [Streptomyces lycii]|uniref:Hydrogenase expression protein HypF n=2 Tax=Streptomyces lycii TaxID=2654337 RepID=A0ABQ7FNS3_9ACTN|nr:hydrogenase expression protein HypF [Streptomyces lycii]